MHITQDEVQMIKSLISSVDKAGGSASTIFSKLDTMTVKELIEILAPNGVRFTIKNKK